MPVMSWSPLSSSKRRRRWVVPPFLGVPTELSRAEVVVVRRMLRGHARSVCKVVVVVKTVSSVHEKKKVSWLGSKITLKLKLRL